MAICKCCEKKLNLVSPDNYVVDRRTNDVYCSNSCMLKVNNTITQKKLKKEKKKVSWICPNCSHTTNVLPVNKKCWNDCGVRYIVK